MSMDALIHHIGRSEVTYQRVPRTPADLGEEMTGDLENDDELSVSTILNRRKKKFIWKVTAGVISVLLILGVLIGVLAYMETHSAQRHTDLGRNHSFFDHGITIGTHRPLIIAHRGSSGALPEHTVEAYRLAISQGADVIECDVCVTKDLKLVCRHESWLSSTTDVMDDATLSLRKTTYYIDSYHGNISDVFTVDLTLDEINSLRTRQRFDFRNQAYNFRFKVATLEDCIAVAKSAARPIAVYPEIKYSSWVNSLDIMQRAGKTIERLLVEILNKHGYISKQDLGLIQVSEERSLNELSKLTTLPIVYILWDSARTDEAFLRKLAKTCYGLAPHKSMIIPEENRYTKKTTNFLQTAHILGLTVHPGVYRNEDQFLAWNYSANVYKEYQKFFELGVDGYFTDFPDSLHDFFNQKYNQRCSNAASQPIVIEIVVLLSIYGIISRI